jgi:hypothetical protein
MIELTGKKNPYKLHTTFHAKVAWPHRILHKGTDFFFTGKEGLSIKNGTPSAEYAHKITGVVDERIWLDANNNITED